MNSSLPIEVNSTLTTAFHILGKRWTGLIITVLDSGPHHFTEILAQIPELNDAILSKRLKELIADDIVTRTVVPGSPVEILYSLTVKGAALHSALNEVSQWGKVWLH